MVLYDEDGLEEKTHYLDEFENRGFQIIRYKDDLSFRIEWEDQFKNGRDKYLILAQPKAYIPYDILQACGSYRFRISLANLFSRLNVQCVRDWPNLNYDLLCMAYKSLFDDCRTYDKTKDFIDDVVYGKDNVREYVNQRIKDVSVQVEKAQNYRDWSKVAEAKSEIDVFCAVYGIDANAEFVQEPFLKYVLENFGKLSGKITSDRETPVLVKGAMDYMYSHSDKFVIIVMDGMSEFDWTILSQSFGDIKYERSAAFAMIPTITSLSRQSLVSSKYPLQLLSPWSTSKEGKEFTDCAMSFDLRKEQVEYHRGYDADFGPTIRCGCVIINDIDDMVHGQQQGRSGMYRDVEYLASTKKLATLVRNLLGKGFDVYISADHGNTPCVGQGKLMKLGVETETKSHRMLVLEQFANKEKMKEQYDMIEYPKYFLDKKYDYLICNIGKSFDAKGDKVMTHGGITVDEVIVPFIKIKAVDNNG
ncbi:PglZ domain-containing protein [uncultured Pseudoramibacter sp.]|uniref:PglZ domain-containing protein n=1 Tax=uncultured Pseudoramibacter sp. TaxID=1623493 RepID=UPI0025F80ED6|nr:PglZ domain-containing protein [uncultured Pseudoramibacter sp.]